MWLGSSIAKSVSLRTGLEEIGHMKVKYLWAQQAVKEKRVELRKISGTYSPGDVLTKLKSANDNGDIMKTVGATVRRRKVQQPRWADVVSEGDEF